MSWLNGISGTVMAYLILGVLRELSQITFEFFGIFRPCTVTVVYLALFRPPLNANVICEDLV